MSDGKGLINININGDKIGEAGKVLIEKISEGIGGLCAPWQTTRMAEARAKAARTELDSDITLTDVQRRAQARWLAEETKHQENIERITAQAIPLLGHESTPEKIDPDWVANFFQKSRIVSDEEMQSLWSRLLANEANSPGSVSRRAVNLLADLDKEDAEKFSILSNFCWSFGKPTPMIFGHTDDVVMKYGLNFESLAHLESLGLVRIAVSEFKYTNLVPGVVSFDYFKRKLVLNLQSSDLYTGKVMLTPTGVQLSKVATTGPLDDVFEYVREHYKGKGLLFAAE